MRLLRLLAALASLALFVQQAAAQAVGNSSNGGAPENAVFHGSDLDAVQTNNGSLQISIPLSSTPGRGISTGWSYVYNNKGWHANSFHDGTTANIKPNLGNSMGWRLIGPVPSAASLSTKAVSQACGTVIVWAKVFTVVEADGTRHHMLPDPTLNGGGNFCNWTADSLDHYADDGSGWILRGGSTLYRKDGALMGGAVSTTGGSAPQDVVTIPPKITDSNGNQAYGTTNGLVITYTDSLGRTIPAPTTVTDANGNILSQQIPYYSADGTLRNIQVQFVAVSVSTQLCPPTSGGCLEYSGTWYVPQTITLANGLFYSFTYDPVTAELTSMTLPSGARIDYTYAEQFYPLTRDTGGRSVTSRKITAGTQSSIWTYSYNLGDTSSTTTVVDPLLNQTVYQCTNLGASGENQWDHAICYTTEIDPYRGNGTGAALLKKVQTDYWATLYAVKPKAVTTTTYSTVSGDASVLKTRVETDYNTFAVNEPTVIGDLTNGNVVESREFSYDSSGNNPVLVRRTHFSYLSDGNAQYSNINISNRVTDKAVYDCLTAFCTAPISVGSYGTPYSGGRLVAETQTSYDSTGVLNANGNPTSVTVPGHDDTNYSSAYTLRGNPTQVRIWLNTTNAWLATNNSFDLLGHMISTTDPGNHTTTFSYSDDWNGWNATTACLPPNNTFAFLTDTKNALSQHSHTTYFPCSGQVQTAKDQNDIVNNRAGTIFTYDPMKRSLTKTASDGGQTSYLYSDSLADFSAMVTTKVTSSMNHVVKTSYDSLGREVRTALLSDPDGVTYTDITYDELGRKKTVTNPYRSTTDSTYGTTSYIFDALGRTVTTIPPDGSSTANNASVQFGGNYTITTDQTGRQRRRYFDSFGRVIEVDEPSGAFPGRDAGGSVNISGSLQSGLFGNHPASPATGSVTVSGNENIICINNRCTPDQGTVTITVNGHADSVSFAGASTFSTIAAGLVSAINNDTAAFTNANCDDAPCSNGVVHLTARISGANTNYSLSCSVTQNQGSFDCLPSGTFLTGGQDFAAGIFVYDAGSVTLSLAGYSATANYGNGTGLDGTAAAVAADLVTKIQAQIPASNPPFSISVPQNGTTINIGWNTPTAAGNVTVTTSSSTTQTAYFSVPSFGGCGQPTTNPQNCSTSLTGGADPAPSDLSNPYITLYKYDVLNNLFCVEQHGGVTGTPCPASTDPSNPVASDPNNPWRVRQFGYDSLNRLRWSSNPESGVITFGYDADSNMTSKTSPLPNQIGTATVTITYSYDPLHRGTGRTYSNGDPAVSYGYDAAEGSVINGLIIHNGIGHRTSMTDGSGSAAWTYDQEGRLKAENKIIGTVSKNLTYGYNLDGSLVTIIYPSGNTVMYTPAASGTNSAGRIGMVQDLGNSINYVTGSTGVGSYATYASDGSIANFYNGASSGFAGIGNTFSYNKRLQAVNISASTSSQTVFSIGYDFRLGNGDNGNVFQLFNYKDNTRSQIFTYDQLNRVSSGKTSASSAWGTNYTYDAWGNLTQKTAMAGTQSGENFSQAALPTNRLTGFSYDAAGNTTGDGINSYVYDGENQIVSVAGVTYTYDGDGARVKKSSGRLYWAASVGTVAESDLSGTLTAEYIFFGGERIARRDYPSGAAHYYFSDHLKSTSVVTSASGSIEEESDYHTWGEESVITHTLADQHYKFNGKERDSETGFDEFGARLYSSAWGRWLIPDWSADPTPVPYAQMDNPQSLNLYAYVVNNPTTFPDLDGHAQASGTVTCAGDAGHCADSSEKRPDQTIQALSQQTKAAKQPGTDANGSWAGAVVAAVPKTIEEINAVVRPLVKSATDAVVEPLVESAIGATQKAGSVVLSTGETALGALAFVIVSSTKTASEKQDTIQGHQQDNTSAEPAPAAGGSGRGVRGGKKDRSLQGNIDQLEGLEHHQKSTTKQSGYRVNTGKSKQNLKKRLKDIQSLKDVEN